MTAWIKPHWNFQAFDGDEMTPFDWRFHPNRRWIELQGEDRHVHMAQIICALTRPANPNLSLRYLQALANGELIRKWGRAHERFADAPRKKRSEIERPFVGTEDLLHRALLAGKALQIAWERAHFPREFGSVLAKVGAEVFDLANEHSMAGQAVDRLPPSSDVRKKLWSDFIPVVHIAMATREILASCGIGTGEERCIPLANGSPASPGDLLYSLVFHQPNTAMAPLIAERAEEIAYQLQHQRLLKRPEKLVAIRRYEAWRGEIFPAMTG